LAIACVAQKDLIGIKPGGLALISEGNQLGINIGGLACVDKMKSKELILRVALVSQNNIFA
jgi:hypothetical protein